MKTESKTLRAAVAAALILALAAGGILLSRKITYDRAAELYAAGDYAEALEKYRKLNREEEAADCEYQIDRQHFEAAELLLEQGEYDGAKAGFEALGDFQNAADRAKECDCRKAAALNAEGRFTEAIEILNSLPGWQPAIELAEKFRSSLYDNALQATYECRLEEAAKQWEQLGDYRDSESLLKRCEERLNGTPTGAEPVTTELQGQGLRNGRLYWNRLGQVYIPNDCGPDTPFLIFYPGGYDTSLSNNYMTEFLYGDPPDAVMLFCYSNGYYDMETKIRESCAIMEQIALEKGIFLHDISVCGASMGTYTALHAAVWLYDNRGICVKNLLSFSAGGYWAVPDHVLSTEQSARLASAGTKLMLFEGEGIGMNKAPIKVMVLNNADVTMVQCRDDGHYQIIYDAMDSGMLHWAVGRGELPTDSNYSYIALDRDSTYPD